MKAASCVIAVRQLRLGARGKDDGAWRQRDALLCNTLAYLAVNAILIDCLVKLRSVYEVLL